MIKNRNLAVAYVDGAVSAAAAAAAIGHLGAWHKAAPGRISKILFAINQKGSGAATTFTVDVKKNGTSVLGTVPTVTIATVTNYAKCDTAKEITATAPTGFSALPVLTSTSATLDLANGDVLEIVVTPNGALATTAAYVSATVIIEQKQP